MVRGINNIIKECTTIVFFLKRVKCAIQTEAKLWTTILIECEQIKPLGLIRNQKMAPKEQKKTLPR